jgi:hypothetical protein
VNLDMYEGQVRHAARARPCDHRAACGVKSWCAAVVQRLCIWPRVRAADHVSAGPQWRGQVDDDQHADWPDFPDSRWRVRVRPERRGRSRVHSCVIVALSVSVSICVVCAARDHVARCPAAVQASTWASARSTTCCGTTSP